jgi:hypothetical protein
MAKRSSQPKKRTFSQRAVQILAILIALSMILVALAPLFEN